MASIGIRKTWHYKARTPEALEQKLTEHQLKTGERLIPLSIYWDGKNHVAWFSCEKKINLASAKIFKESK